MDNTQTTQQQGTVMDNTQWETFSKGALVNFLVSNNLQKITADDGAGRKATVKINSKGEYNVSYTTTEIL